MYFATPKQSFPDKPRLHDKSIHQSILDLGDYALMYTNLTSVFPEVL